MVIYQLLVKGSSASFEAAFKMHSKKVFKYIPTQEEIDAFVKLCADEKYFDYLDINSPYDVKVFELELAD